jgi:tRNA(Ile)-lysidine synthase
MDPFSYKFHQHVEGFMTKMGMMPSSKYLLAVSGGVDSMVLLHFFLTFSKRYAVPLRVATINHGTREGQDKECALVQEYCLEHGIECITHYEHNLGLKNFEANARRVRYQFFHSVLLNDEKLVMAHHLNDSFEWYLMHQFKTSNTKVLGIPACGGRIVRPFMCVSKQQIYSYAKKNKVPYIEDETNSDISYERNYIRQVIAESVAPKYPQYLKHYVNRMNQMIVPVKKNKVQVFRRADCALIKINGSLGTYIPKVVELVHRFSKSERGKIHGQLNKLIKMVESNKWGPLIFSGGVRVYYKDSYLFICSSDFIFADTLSSGHSQTFKNISELRRHLHKLERSKPHLFPFWVQVESIEFKLDYQKQKLKEYTRLIGSDKKIISANRLISQWARQRSKRHHISLITN